MSEADALAWHLASIETAYWREVDLNLGRDATRFYTPDGVFTISGRPMCGHAEIAAFYAWRRERGVRTARHIVSNFFLREHDDTLATLECLMCLHAADGAPILPSAPAIMIADTETRFSRAGPGQPWLMAAHTLTPVFEGGVSATLPL